MSLPVGVPGVSNVTFPKPVWRYALLFQSWSQLQSWGLFVFAAIVLMNFFFGLSETGGPPMEGILVGALLGSLVSVIMVLPTSFVVSPCPERVVHALTSELDVLGYVLLDAQADTVIYRQKLPRMLRWDEGNVSIERAGNTLIVTGPLVILKKSRHFLVHRVNS